MWLDTPLQQLQRKPCALFAQPGVVPVQRLQLGGVAQKQEHHQHRQQQEVRAIKEGAACDQQRQQARRQQRQDRPPVFLVNRCAQQHPGRGEQAQQQHRR
ncbi:hypothetical protein D3C73_993450 [compost metagenome]